MGYEINRELCESKLEFSSSQLSVADLSFAIRAQVPEYSADLEAAYSVSNSGLNDRSALVRQLAYLRTAPTGDPAALASPKTPT